ncbi:MAG: hypothetical protein M3N35_13115, partial [Candidatus Binatota bacterium]|nr:hypothetical protein [Candidatus Binatota bacterium]
MRRRVSAGRTPERCARGSSYSVGIDFGTTNSVLAVATEAGDIEVAQHGRDRSSGNFRSILCFIKGGSAPGSGLIVKAGPDATAAYLD